MNSSSLNSSSLPQPKFCVILTSVTHPHHASIPPRSSVARAREIGYRWRLLLMPNQHTSHVKARSSVVARFPDPEEVGGSLPTVPNFSLPSPSTPVPPATFPCSYAQS